MKSLFILCISICCLLMATVTVAEEEKEEGQWDSANMLDEPAHIAMPASRRRFFSIRRRVVVSRRRSSRISFRINVRHRRNDSNNGHVVKPSNALTVFSILVAILTITKRLFKEKI